MLPKYIVQIILGISRVFGRAIGKAVKEEYLASQQASKGRNNSSKTAESIYTDLSSSISVEEAKLILNIKDFHDIESINEKYILLFENNDKSKGGSLYLQSKVYRAKERIDQEIMNLNK